MKVLLDTGPLVALLNRNDRWHDWARARAATLEPPFLSCEAVISEAHFLLRRIPNGSSRMNDLVGSGRVDVSFSYAPESERIHELMASYRDVPMSFADACLVRMSELEENASVFTVDGDFSIYRGAGSRTIPLIAPPGRDR